MKHSKREGKCIHFDLKKIPAHFPENSRARIGTFDKKIKGFFEFPYCMWSQDLDTTKNTHACVCLALTEPSSTHFIL